MKIWVMTGLALTSAFFHVSRLHAQVAVPPAVGAPVAAPVPAAAPAGNLWGFLCPTPEQCARWKYNLCNSPIGEIFKGMAGPASTFSGGLIGSRCGVPTADDIARLIAEGKGDSAEGAAAKIKKDEAEAAARRAAVRYLGTVDCRYWPEATDALVLSLRGDRNECVRF